MMLVGDTCPSGVQESCKRIRITVTSWETDRLYGYVEQANGERNDVTATFSHLKEYSNFHKLLYKGAQVNLLSCRLNENGIYEPLQIILEPDYLIDITTLADCFKPYGSSPWEALFGKMRPVKSTRHTLLGNMANRFLDDCINHSHEEINNETYKKSVALFFSENALELALCPDIDKSFFDDAARQFANIAGTIRQLLPSSKESNVMLEPSFLCEWLGLQGRMDFYDDSNQRLIELKSGKADEFRHCAALPHAMQIALYKEVLYYNLDIERDSVHSRLFYSKYPSFISDDISVTQIQQALQLRNCIVYIERLLRDGDPATTLSQLTPEKIYPRAAGNALWEKWSCPEWQTLLAPLQTNDSLALAYFYTFLSFTEREQFCDKVGTPTAVEKRGFANLWNIQADTKRANGDMLYGLTIATFSNNGGIDKIVFNTPRNETDFVPNFRKNDIILFYERNSTADTAINRQIVRGTIEEIDDNRISVSLHCKQRNLRLFPLESCYAIEHDYLDSSYRTVYRGLYSFLQAPDRRKQLLLCQREPQNDTTLTLTGDYGNGQINHIVLQAKQAKDFFLLAGPPGTGKTSIALQSMVREFYSDPHCNIMLLAYTNRAVDEICESLDSSPQKFDYIRIGSHLSCEEKFTSHLLKNRIEGCTSRAQVLDRLAGERIFTGTLFSMAGKAELFKLKHFHVAIIDEASQILEPQLAGLLSAIDSRGECAIDKFILIGDHMQLPAISQQDERLATVNDEKLRAIGITDLRRSLFERLYYRQQQAEEGAFTAQLTRQGRMHPVVSRFANLHFYDNRLVAVPLPHQLEPLPFKKYDANNGYERLVATRRTAFIASTDNADEDAQKINRNEAAIIAHLVESICTLYRKNSIPLNLAEDIGIIVPFRNQIALIYKEMSLLGIEGHRLMTIDTVERYQGSQRDIIIYGTTVTQPAQMEFLSTPITIDGRSVDRKLNVALTRARKQMFVVGNPKILAQSALYQSVIDELNGDE